MTLAAAQVHKNVNEAAVAGRARYPFFLKIETVCEPRSAKSVGLGSPGGEELSFRMAPSHS
jgi:hypothetical protein